ncbi:hypothetical protein ACE1TI_15790 [Alteribacillus sp. JSM 102045]|uniref:hypothetical protein n=1 Tax=Alteribacillus sp. JSM 102045 TaxID=1562101 RepID=UPI0035C0437C
MTIMEKQLPVIQKVLELSETMGEGLQHIQYLLNEGKIESALPLFEDVIYAFSVSEQSLQPVIESQHFDTIQAQHHTFRESLQYIVTILEKGEFEKGKEVLQFTLLPRWKKWSSTLETSFRAYLVS